MSTYSTHPNLAEHPMATSRSTSTLGSPGAWPRALNVLLGAWLFISAFLWPHMEGSRANSWVVGLALAVIALFSAARSELRIVNAALSMWLLLSTLFIFRSMPATFWNNVIVAVLAFIVSLTSNRTPTRT